MFSPALRFALLQNDSNICVAGVLFGKGRGGISHVSRLTLKSLPVHCRISVLSLLDKQLEGTFGVPTTFCYGSRLTFALAYYRSIFCGSRFIFDQLGPARVCIGLPGLKQPFCVWIHGMETWENGRRDRLAAARRAKLLIANSNYTRQRALQLHGAPFDRAKVCWLATEEDEPPSEPARFDGPPTVLILARIDAGEQYKGHRELIECWPGVVSAVPPARLLIVGGGSGLRAVRAQVAGSTVAANIDVTGFVPEDDMEGIWRRTHVLAMPSRGEGFGLVYIEAMRRGLPVIASVHDAAPEVNLDNVTGYNVDLERPDDLPERIIHLLRDPDHAAALGRAGQARWAEHFRYSAFRQRFTPIISDFLASR